MKVNRTKFEGSRSYSWTTFIVEWVLKALPKTRVVGEVNVGGLDAIAVDKRNRRVYISGGGVAHAYSFATQSSETDLFVSSGQIDFHAKYGLLVSKTSLQRYNEDLSINRYDSYGGAKVVVTEGLSAAWGEDGKVYFVDSKEQLWRCNGDGSDRELVYTNPCMSRKRRRHLQFPPVLSSDRTVLAFRFGTHGLVVIDLLRAEYIELLASRVNSRTMRILVPSNRGSTPVQ